MSFTITSRSPASYRYHEEVLLSLLCFLIAPVPYPAAAGLFPLVHDEAYNFIRLWLDWRALMRTDRPPLQVAWSLYRYGYQSSTTTARMDFNGTQRTAFAGAALLVWLAGALLL